MLDDNVLDLAQNPLPTKDSFELVGIFKQIDDYTFGYQFRYRTFMTGSDRQQLKKRNFSQKNPCLTQLQRCPRVAKARLSTSFST
jgi:hypothetical protein